MRDAENNREKWLAVTLLAVSVVLVGGITTMLAQVFRGHTPVDFSSYLIINGIVVLPGVIFMTALVVALNGARMLVHYGFKWLEYPYYPEYEYPFGVWSDAAYGTDACFANEDGVIEADEFKVEPNEIKSNTSDS